MQSRDLRAINSMADLVQLPWVHGDAYTDERVFRAELDRIFTDGWVYLGHESEVPHPGDYRRKRLGDQPLILVRDDDDTVRVLLNRCRHRGALVCQEERGNAQYFRCQYHGWTYGSDGRLVGVPFRRGYDDAEGFSREAFGLTELPVVDRYRGFLFGSAGKPELPLVDYLGELVLERIDRLVNLSPTGKIELLGPTRHQYRGNWKLQLENGPDGYHPQFTHPRFLGILKDRTAGSDRAKNYTKDGAGQFTVDYGRGHSGGDISDSHRPTDADAWREILDAEILAADIATLSASTVAPAYRETGGTSLFPALSAETARGYVDALISAHGETAAREAVERSGDFTVVFPNLFLLGPQVRVIQPMAVERTEVEYYPVHFLGAPDEFNEQRLRGQEAFYGPGAIASPDDFEMFERIQEGLQAKVDPWIFLGRGSGREVPDDRAVLRSDITDEQGQRSIWRQWQTMMEEANQ